MNLARVTYRQVDYWVEETCLHQRALTGAVSLTGLLAPPGRSHTQPTSHPRNDRELTPGLRVVIERGTAEYGQPNRAVTQG
jgi:hypothetical protein